MDFQVLEEKIGLLAQTVDEMKDMIAFPKENQNQLFFELAHDLHCQTNEYEKTYTLFWKDTVEKEGVLDKDAVMQALADFTNITEAVSRVYAHITNNQISMANTDPHTVMAAADESYDELYKEDAEEARGIIPLCAEALILKDSSYDETKKKIVERIQELIMPYILFLLEDDTVKGRLDILKNRS